MYAASDLMSSHPFRRQGKGDGTFRPPRAFGVEPGLAPQDVAVGDLNGDLHADIITANALSNDITVLRGKTTRWGL